MRNGSWKLAPGQTSKMALKVPVYDIMAAQNPPGGDSSHVHGRKPPRWTAENAESCSHAALLDYSPCPVGSETWQTGTEGPLSYSKAETARGLS